MQKWIFHCFPVFKPSAKSSCVSDCLFLIRIQLLRPPRGSVKLVSTNLTNLVPLEQFHQKPTKVYDGGLLKALGEK